MKRINRENQFLIVWLICLVLLLGACNLGFIRETWAAFGNLTGQLTAPYTMKYLSNFPSDLGLEEEQKTENVVGKNYTIKENSFVVDGYEFVNWNTLSDGTGDAYNVNDNITLEKNLMFYAQWKEIEVVMVSYGDVNINGEIDEDDYLLIEKFILEGSQLTEQGTLNADVNTDGKIDLVDADIIKQVCLGTDGYVGILPSKPILIYEIYKGNSSNDTEIEEDDTDVDNDDKELEDGEESSGGSSSDSGSSNEGTGSDNATGSSGNGTSGSGHGGNTSSGSGNGSSGGNKPSSGSSASGNGNNQSSSSIDEDKDDDTLDIPIENGKEDVLEENEGNVNNNYEDNDDSNNNLINKPNTLYVSLIVFCICLFSLRLVIHIIYKFRQKEKKDTSDK